jgi:putative transposase
LNETLFLSLAHVRTVLRAWRDDYNHVRRHSGIGGLTPANVATQVALPSPGGHHSNSDFKHDWRSFANRVSEPSLNPDR